MVILIRQEKVKQIKQPCFSVYMEPHMIVSLVLIPLLHILGALNPIF